MSVARELKALQKEWTKSKARDTNQPVPDGNYIVKMLDVQLEKSKNSNRLQIAQIMQITSSKEKDRMLYRYSGIETQGNMEFFKGDLKRLGIKIPKNILKLTDKLEEMIDLEISVTVKTRGEFQNIFVNGLAEEETEEAEEIEDEEFEEE